MHFLLIYYIILFAHSKQHERIKYEGLSPNGKATDSDSVIFQVRILVALVERYSFECLFLYSFINDTPVSQPAVLLHSSPMQILFLFRYFGRNQCSDILIFSITVTSINRSFLFQNRCYCVNNSMNRKNLKNSKKVLAFL